MLSPSDNFGEGITFSGCPFAAFVRSSVRSFVRSDRSYYHDILQTARAVLMKLIADIYQPLLMTWLDFGDRKSKVKVEEENRPSKWRSHPRRRWGIEVHVLVLWKYTVKRSELRHIPPLFGGVTGSGYLPSHRASPPLDRYQVILLYCLVTEAHRCQQLAQGSFCPE